MKNLGTVCIATVILRNVGALPSGGMEEITVKNTNITADQLRTRDGEELYRSLCSACHGETGAGDGPAAPALYPHPVDLTQLAKENGGTYPSRAVYTSISGRYDSLHSRTDMPCWEELFRQTTGDRRKARQVVYLLNKHVRSLQATR